MTAFSADFLGYHCHNIPNINPCLLNQIAADTPAEIVFTYYQSTTDPPTYCRTQNSQHPKRTTIWHLGTLDHPNQHKTTAFPDMTVKITNNNRFRLPTNTTNNPKDTSFPTKPPNSPRHYFLSLCFQQFSFQSILSPIHSCARCTSV